jgi:hypothetical protein
MIATIARVSTAIALVFGGVGCASYGMPGHNEAFLHENDFESVLAYSERARLLPEAALVQEYARLRQGYASRPNAADRVKLAVLLSLRHAPFRDDAQARGLLLQAASDSSYNVDEYRTLAALLLAVLDERREMERALEDERRQRAELAKKLKQLRAIEEEIDRRTPAPMIPSR